MLKIIIAGTIAAIATIPTAAMADEAAPTIRVHYGDLDLSRADGRAALDRRMGKAVSALCGSPENRDLIAMSAASRCRSIARGSASQQVAALTGGYSLASAKTGSANLPG